VVVETPPQALGMFHDRRIAGVYNVGGGAPLWLRVDHRHRRRAVREEAMTVITAPKGNLIRNGSVARDSSRIEPV
jgi:hypothetical protein